MRFITVKRISLGSAANGQYDKKLHFRSLKQKEISIGYILCLDGSTNGDFLIEQFIASAKVTNQKYQNIIMVEKYELTLEGKVAKRVST